MICFAPFCDLLYFSDQFSSFHIWHESGQVCTHLCIRAVAYTHIYNMTKFRFFVQNFFVYSFFPHSSQLYCIFFSFWLRNVTIFFEFMAAMPFVHCININYRAQSTLMLQLISSMNITSISLARSIVFSLYLNQYFHFSIQSKLIIIFFKIHLLFVDPRTLTLIQSYDNSSEIFANWVEF